MNRLILILWPSFLIAGVAECVFFTLVDPQTLYFLGYPVHYSAVATYSLGFFAFWMLCGLTAWTTLFFARSSGEVNHPTSAQGKS